MRLTLRTLLAYLDDRLTPSNAREIGQKIAQSPFASELAERIRDVVRRRRLADPDRSESMIEANLVAEYLDDQLSPELVARIEREILHSDASLAEVAAVHEILGLLREPVALEPRLRDRLYALDPSGKQAVAQALEGTANEVPASVSRTTEALPEWKPLAARPSTSQRMPVIVLALLAIVWVILVVSDGNLFRTVPPTKIAEVPQERDGGLVPDGGVTDPGAGASGGQGSVVAAGGAAAGPGSESGPGAANAAGDSAAATGAAETAVAAASGPDGTLPTAPGIPQQPETAEATAGTDGPVASDSVEPAGSVAADGGEGDEVEASEQRVPRFSLIDDDRMAILKDEAAEDWQSAALIAGRGLTAEQLSLRDWRAELSARWMGVSASFRTRIVADQTGWSGEVSGPAILKVIAEGNTGIDLLEGRVLISRTSAAGIPDDSPVEFQLRTGSVDTQMTLKSSDTRFGVEVRGVVSGAERAERKRRMIRRPVDEEAADQPGADQPGADQPGADQEDQSGAAANRDRTNSAFDEVPVTGRIEDESAEAELSLLPTAADFEVRLCLAQGSLEVTLPGGEQSQVLTAPRLLQWNVLDGRHSADVVLSAEGQLTQIPGWVFESSAEPIPEQQAIRRQVALEVATAESLRAAVLALISERNPQVGVAAVKIAAVTRDIDTLLESLMQASGESVRRAAIDGLEQAAIQTSRGGQMVRDAIESRLPMSEAAVVMELIMGLTEQDGRNPAMCRWLLFLMGHDRLLVRELAFYRLELLAGDRFGFHADADPARRRDALRRLQRTLDRNGGRLLPE